MTNSTIICLEANKVAAELQSYSPTDSLTSLELDNIRPPLEFDCVSLSTATYDIPDTYSPQKFRSRKKSLSNGIMARRALGQLGERGSAESVNSLGLINIDNIKPPSIMDDLLDSITSVASITSEVADSRTISPYLLSITNSDIKMDLSNENDATPIPSDFSSNESTPRKGELKRSLTPKQKRQNCDRYKTYTIAGNIIDDLKRQDDQNDESGQLESAIHDSRQSSEWYNNRLKTPTLINHENINHMPDARDDQTHYYEEEHLLYEPANDCLTFLSNVDSTEKLSTTHLKYGQNGNMSNLNQTKALKMRPLVNRSDSMNLECEQNSETTSCDLDSNGDENGSSLESKSIRGNTRPAYVSPYKRTSLSKASHTTPKVFPTKQVAVKKSTNSSLNKKSSSVETKKQTISSRSNSSNKLNKPFTNLEHPSFTKPIDVSGESPQGEVLGKKQTNNSHFEATTYPPKLTERQGTFIKEEGTDLELPVVTSAPATPSKQRKLTSQIPAKTSSIAKTFVSKMRVPLYRSGSTPDPNEGKSRKSYINKSSSNPAVNRSNSNASIKIPLSSSKHTLVSGQTTLAAPKRDITSKISVIWKRNDESKKQQTLKKDVTLPKPHKLIRSSTFDASPEPGAAKILPNITKGKTLKSPSSGNLKNIANSSGTERRTIKRFV